MARYEQGKLNFIALMKTAVDPADQEKAHLLNLPKVSLCAGDFGRESRERESNNWSTSLKEEREGEWNYALRVATFLCLTSLVGSSLHFSGARIWGWREDIVKGMTEAALDPRQLGAGVWVIGLRGRSGVGCASRWNHFPVMGIRTGAPRATAYSPAAPPSEKVPARGGLATRPRAR